MSDFQDWASGGDSQVELVGELGKGAGGEVYKVDSQDS